MPSNLNNPIKNWTIHIIDDLDTLELGELLSESKEQGFRFVDRLLTDYQEGRNRFNQKGEILCGVYDPDGRIIGIGGVNIEKDEICRLRRFYILSSARGLGVGKELVHYLMDFASEHYKTMVLHTDTEKASKFYEALGFHINSPYTNTTHFINLQ
ncbi:GNAT family N-acetyltransferase [Peribacillus acanthi]|uniref:GNAT family N-acetyltransferase n=1 Tax=Peribacillus acanthi TaxID=2171554 RepID=UPI000D3ED5BB|nr:GNAT family N-acetyltransferase [Peribacillus acanthi]